MKLWDYEMLLSNLETLTKKFKNIKYVGEFEIWDDGVALCYVMDKIFEDIKKDDYLKKIMGDKKHE